MKLKTVKRFLAAGCILMVLAFVLLSATKRAFWGYIGAAFAFLSVLFMIIFGRCPHCGRFLGIAIGRPHCPHCGEKVE